MRASKARGLNTPTPERPALKPYHALICSAVAQMSQCPGNLARGLKHEGKLLHGALFFDDIPFGVWEC
jgi:hypothetical protein